MPSPFAAPTLFTRMSTVLHALTADVTTFSQPSADATSPWTAMIDSGSVINRSSAAAFSSVSAPLAQMHTRHPSDASAFALPKPSPLLEPVTMATFPVS